jgi:trigger factor
MASEFDTIAELRESLAERVSEQSVYVQGAAARDKLIEALLAKVEIPCRRSSSRTRCTHLEGEGRLEDDEHRAEVTEASEKQFRTR